MATLTQVLSPNTLADMNVEAELKLKAINKKLKMESVLGDIFEDLGADVIYSGKEIMVPNAIFFKLGAQPTGARQVTIPMLKALTGSLTLGATTPVGAEEKQYMKYCTFFYEEYSYAVASSNWGTNYNDMSVYGVFEQIQPQMSKYLKEMRGRRIREACLQTYDHVLQNLSAISARWNKNWFIANTDLGSQPAYDSTHATFTEAIGDALIAAGGTGDGSSANIDLNYLLSLDYYAPNYLRIDPIMVGGQRTYVVLIPSSQVQILKRNTSGQLGEIYTSMVRTDVDEMKYTGVIGRVGNLLLVEDQRYPTVTVGGTDGSWTITPQYVSPGNTDGRNKAVYDGTNLPGAEAVNASFDVGFLLGAGAICEWEVRAPHFETEKQNYGRDQGNGVFGESGISLVQYDTDTGWGETTDLRENIGSIVLAWTAPAITA